MSNSKKILPVKQLVKNGLPAVFADILNMPEGTDEERVLKNRAVYQFVNDLAERGENVTYDLHNVAIYAMENAMANNNSFALMTAVQKAAVRMKGIRYARLAQWFAENSPASWDKKGEKFVTGEGKTNESWNIENAKAYPFYEQVDTVPEPFNLENFLRSMKTAISRAESAKANTEQSQKLKELAKLLKTTVVPAVEHAQKAFETEVASGILDGSAIEGTDETVIEDQDTVMETQTVAA